MAAVKTPEVEQAAQLRSSLSQQIDGIRKNSQLTDAGKRQQIKAATDTAKASVAKLRGAHRDRLAGRFSELETNLFGQSAKGLSGAALMAYRDAEDRAAKVAKQGEAVTVMERALTSGDAGLAAALARRAVAMDWAEAFGAWRDARRATLPEVDDVLTELRDIEPELTTTGDLFAFSLPSVAEVSAWSGADSLAPQQKPADVGASPYLSRV